METIKTQYAVGFLFSPDFARVALIKKLKPEWQRGKLNGIGGHIEPGETPDAAMAREFFEEAEYSHPPTWREFAVLNGADFTLFCYVAVGELDVIGSKTAEIIEIVPVAEINPLRNDVIENLPWLISLAIDVKKAVRPRFATIQYS